MDRDGCFIIIITALIIIGLPAVFLGFRLLELWIKTH